MRVSIRTHLTGGVSVLAAGIIAIPLAVPPQVPTAAPSIELAATVQPLVIDPPSPLQFAAAMDAIARIAPSTLQTAVAPATPAPLNAASDLITSGYQFIQYFVDYGVQLTNYVLGFIPYGYLIADQINIVYFSLIRPIADSVVYGLINPVVNDPLNPASYVNGLINVGQTTINALINTGIAEFNYFFGRFLPPLPPLPLSSAAAAATQSVDEEHAVPSMAADLEPTTDTAPVAKQPEVMATVETLTIGETAPESPSTDVNGATGERQSTTVSANGVTARDEVRDGNDGAESPTDAESTTATDARVDHDADTPADDEKAAPADTKDADDEKAAPAKPKDADADGAKDRPADSGENG